MCWQIDLKESNIEVKFALPSTTNFQTIICAEQVQDGNEMRKSLRRRSLRLIRQVVWQGRWQFVFELLVQRLPKALRKSVGEHYFCSVFCRLIALNYGISHKLCVIDLIEIG